MAEDVGLAPVTVYSSGMPTILKPRCTVSLQQQSCTRFAQAAVDEVLFDGHDGAAFGRGLQDRVRRRAA